MYSERRREKRGIKEEEIVINDIKIKNKGKKGRANESRREREREGEITLYMYDERKQKI